MKCAHSKIVVQGELVAEGTDAKSITFTSSKEAPAAGDWGYIQFMDGSTGIMRHVVVEYAGYQYTVSDNGLVFSQIGAAVYVWGGIVVLDHVNVRHIHNPVMYQTVDRTAYGIWASYSPTLTISNCVIEDVESYGIYNGSSGVVKITDSNISDCGSWGIVTGSGGSVEVVGNTIAGSGGGIHTSHPTAVITGNDLVGNGNDNANYVSGTIAVDTTWENNVLFNGVTVAPGARLTIQPGMRCSGSGTSSRIVVQGELVAEGTDAKSITFTSSKETPTAGDWGYIQFTDGSTGSLRHVVVEYAGYQSYIGLSNGFDFSSFTGAALFVGGGSVVLDQVKVRHIHNPYLHPYYDPPVAYGIYARYSPTLTISKCFVEDVAYGIYNGSSGVVKITDSNISDCGSWGIVTGSGGSVEVVGNTIAGSGGGIHTSHPTAVITGNDLVGNGNDNANYVSGTIAVDSTWENNVRFHQVTVAPGARLTIQPGMRCSGHDTLSRIVVQGELVAEGTDAKSITFTSSKEAPAAGDWGYIQFTDGSTGSLRHVVMEYAGYQSYIGLSNGFDFSSFTGAALFVGGGSVVLDQVKVRHIHNPYLHPYYDPPVSYGICARYSPTLSILNCVVEDVESWGVYNQTANKLDLRYSIIRNNGYGLYSSSGLVDARMVDWGDTSGPYHATMNTAGAGNEVRGNVIFMPWLHLNSTFDDFESGEWGPLSWNPTGDGSWSVSDVDPVGGSYSAKAPVIADGQTATLSVIAACEEGYVSFRYAVDSEENGDFLEFYIDGNRVDAWSGNITATVAPTTDAYKVTADAHTFSWVWKKNASGSAGRDTAWIDDVILPRAKGHMEGEVVTDASGADTPLIGATVTLSDGAQQFTTPTDADGNYSFYNIPFGDYTLSIVKDGFKTVTQDVTVDSLGIVVIPVTSVPMAQFANGLYTQEQLDQAVIDERLRWDINGDNRISLEEAVNALQVVSDIHN